jgi:hypothetical protein
MSELSIKYRAVKSGIVAAYVFLGVMCVPAVMNPGFLIPARRVVVVVFGAAVIQVLTQSIAILILRRGDKK